MRTENGQTTESSYAYDALGQLTSFLQSTGYGEQYAYDKAGNMTEKVITPLHRERGSTGCHTQDELQQGQPTHRHGQRKDKITYSYDKNGSMVQKVLSSQTYGKLTDTYAYNALDQLTSYTGYDGYIPSSSPTTPTACAFPGAGGRREPLHAGGAAARGTLPGCRRLWSRRRARPTRTKRTCPPSWNGPRRNTCMI